jgi:ParB-like chromosome segregation protein Spo0J
LTDAPQAAGLVTLADRIELWPIDRLRPYERNPRTHSEGQVDQIAVSMVEFGWANPVLVDEQDGILAGHGRLLAARKLGLAEVPVIQFEHLSEAQKRAYLIADNQLALQAGWVDALLAEELAWLRDERFDLDLIGFDASELERLLALAEGEAASNEAEDEFPSPSRHSAASEARTTSMLSRSRSTSRKAMRRRVMPPSTTSSKGPEPCLRLTYPRRSRLRPDLWAARAEHRGGRGRTGNQEREAHRDRRLRERRTARLITGTFAGDDDGASLWFERASAHEARDRLRPGGDRQLPPHALQPLQPGQRAGLAVPLPISAADEKATLRG